MGIPGGIGRGEGVPTSMSKHAAAKTRNTESEVVEFGGRCVRYQVRAREWRSRNSILLAKARAPYLRVDRVEVFYTLIYIHRYRM